jgi:hypothetical protein
LKRFLVVFIFILSVPLGVYAKEIKYNHNSMTIPEIKEKVDFNVLSPKQLPSDWTLEIKTYPWGEKDNITDFNLHYMGKSDQYLMVSIGERKEILKKEEPLSPYTEAIDINGNKGYFEAWGNSGELDKKGNKITGGILFWVQEGTYIEMVSMNITKDKMIEIAKSMK